MSILLSIIILPLLTITSLQGVRNVPYPNPYSFDPSDIQRYYTTASPIPIPTPKLDCYPNCPPENLEELNTCIRCMKRDESNKFHRCIMVFQDTMHNSTLPTDRTDHCDSLSQFFNCAAPILYRNCPQCAIKQFVKHHRPHTELCLLIKLNQPMTEQFFLNSES